MALVFGIAQPAILELFGVHAGDNLPVADVIAVLLTVLGLLAASFGVAVYSVVRRTLEEKLTSTIELAQRRQDQEMAFAMLTMTLFFASEAWQRVEPYFIEPPVDELRAAQRDSIIRYGLDSSNNAAYWLGRCDHERRTGKRWPTVVRLNQALFLACRVRARGSVGDDDAADARRLVPTIDQVESAESQETIAWVRVCCYPVGSEDWEEGRSLARRLMEHHGSEIMRRRYHAAFPDAFPLD